MCSGVLMVMEAKGLVIQANDKEWTIKSTYIFASNSFVHEQIQINFE